MSGRPPVDYLYVTLLKGFMGKPRALREIIKSLGICRNYQTVQVKNYPSIRGMIEKVLHLVQVETDDQYYERKKLEASRLAPRPPVRVTHAMPYWVSYLPTENQKVTNIYDKDRFWQMYGKSRRYLEPDFVDKLVQMDKERRERKQRERAGVFTAHVESEDVGQDDKGEETESQENSQADKDQSSPN
eukprot:TRINITY_DN12163_c0_g1_i2.p4 TRINITY_DN12163_c0_g1~~TRINITY_DN12163_c0_g1_i2.p4  ORF type:complete len:187 (+),score=14.20 TRINITY_DN12163_c0_g1_i2:115-675(+)